MDVRMPQVDGIEATRRLLAADGVDTKVVMLTTFDMDEYVYDALRAGASGFLLKDVPPEQLVAGIRAVAQGDALLAPSVTRRVIEEFVRRPPSSVRTLPPEVDEPDGAGARGPEARSHAASRTPRSRKSSSSARRP